MTEHQLNNAFAGRQPPVTPRMQSLRHAFNDGFAVGYGLMFVLALIVVGSINLAWEYWPATRPAWLLKLAETNAATSSATQSSTPAAPPAQPKGGAK